MRYYVTGANGFIGKHVVKYLNHGENIVVPMARPFIHSTDFIQSREDYSVIHLSSFGNHSYQQDPKKIINANILDLHILLSCPKGYHFNKFYNVSTSAIQLPVKTLYSSSKDFGEMLVKSKDDNRYVNVRPYSVYGPGEADHRFIPTVIRALHSGEAIQLDEHATHDWIFVDDFIKAMFDGYTNIGTGKSYTNLDIVWMLEHISGKKLNYQPAKMRSYDTANWVCPDGVPHRDIMEGLKQTYESFTR